MQIGRRLVTVAEGSKDTTPAIVAAGASVKAIAASVPPSPTPARMGVK